ncbi:MAG: hypothetical protein ALECFALPRED_006380 [Alectoria fallacina]|uniref:Uncharacterized protein n=1 Tax=Alectoria fallacina TaxID=1903189 RepID=A0A8H3G2E6_9LECA|nr:MAG: hypothetical protein ALECFALPRED_006380 [Alectoria fallacina]
MGCAPSKPSSVRSRTSEPPFPPYNRPKEFRGSVMPQRNPDHQAPPFPPYTGPKEFHTSVMPERNPNRRAPQMYKAYQEEERQRVKNKERRYSWEGHSSEKVFTTFDSLAERGIISKDSLRKK